MPPGTSRREFTLGLFAFAGLAACGIKATDDTEEADDTDADGTTDTDAPDTATPPGRRAAPPR